jgi:hypothetical protein
LKLRCNPLLELVAFGLHGRHVFDKGRYAPAKLPVLLYVPLETRGYLPLLDF